jgi:cation:H+ antiporter
MVLNLVYLVLGLVALIFGADWLIRGVSEIARRLGVPPIVIGLTVVAFGTSMPEVVVNTVSAWQGQTDLAFGNIVGSCAVNIGFVLALTAIIRPLAVESSVVRRELPTLLLTVFAALILTSDRWLNGGGGGVVDQLTRGDGVMLLLLFCVFLYTTVVLTLLQPKDPLVVNVLVRARQESREANQADPITGSAVGDVGAAAAASLIEGPASRAGDGASVIAVVKDAPAAGALATPTIDKSDDANQPPKPLWFYLILTVVGLVGVAAGGRIVVANAVAIAEAFKVPANIIGLTIVSLGTTLPELTTGIIAARRGQADIAIGNVVGSCIFNLLFIGGIASVISPVPVPPGGHADLLMVVLLSVLLLPFSLRQKRITRGEGAILMAMYGTYLGLRTTGVL